MNKIHNFINGQIVESESKEFSPVFNPATGEVIAEVVQSTEADIEARWQPLNVVFFLL